MTRDEIMRKVLAIPAYKANKLEARGREWRLGFSYDIRHEISADLEELIHRLKHTITEETRRIL